MGDTPLHLALANDAKEEMLLEMVTACRGAVKQKNRKGNTPLHIAFAPNLFNFGNAFRDFGAQTWYAGNITLQAAKEMVLQTGVGSFLIRDRAGHYDLAVNAGNGAVIHKITESVYESFFLESESFYGSMQELIDHYTESPLPGTSLKLIQPLLATASRLLLSFVNACPTAVGEKNKKGNTPLHLALQHSAAEDVLLAMVAVAPPGHHQREE